MEFEFSGGIGIEVVGGIYYIVVLTLNFDWEVDVRFFIKDL